MLPLVVSRNLGAWYIWSPSAYPPWKVWNLPPSFIIPPLLSQPHGLLALVWECSAAPGFYFCSCDSMICVFANLYRRVPAVPPPPVGERSGACFSCGPRLCQSRSSSTNHMILDSFTAVRTVPQSSCETRCSCCFASLCLQKATAGGCDAGAALQAPQISALPRIPFSNTTALKVSLIFFLITVSYFSFINLNIIAYLLRLHFKELCLFSCNYPRVF